MQYLNASYNLQLVITAFEAFSLSQKKMEIYVHFCKLRRMKNCSRNEINLGSQGEMKPG